jgi:hypothetical protein
MLPWLTVCELPARTETFCPQAEVVNGSLQNRTGLTGRNYRVGCYAVPLWAKIGNSGRTKNLREQRIEIRCNSKHVDATEHG